MMIRILCTFFVLFLINETKAAKNLVCDVRIRDDPFDSGFQKVRTQSVICEFNEAVEIAEPTILANPVNENVTELLLRRIKKIEFLPQDISAAFPNLRLIDAFDCSIKSVSNLNLKGLSKNKKINLEKNNLETIEENAFDDLVNLRYLYLDENKITQLPSNIFDNNQQLDFLYLKQNQLTNLNVDIFKNNKKIALLHLSDNKLQTLPSEILEGFTLLRQLWLKSNEIVDLPPHIFDSCESLIDIDLSRNKIKTIDINLLANLNALREISFSFNPLKFIDLTIFDKNENLVEFFFNSVATKDIRNIEKVDLMTKIKTIGLHDTCVNDQFHEGNLDVLKKAVKEKCVK